MGHFYSIYCACGYRKNITHGIGMIPGVTKERVDEIKNARERRIITNILNEHPDCKTTAFHTLFLCQDCGRILNDTQMVIEYGPGQTYKREFYCYKCGADTKEFEIDDSISENDLNAKLGIPCPRCRKPLMITLTGLWD